MHPVLLIDLAKRYGGAEVRVFDLAASLHGRCPYAVATLAGSPLHRRLEAAGLVSLPVPYARSDPRLLLFTLRAIRRGGFRVVDAHNPQSQFWGHLAAILAGAQVKISTVHSAYRFEHNGSLKGWAYEQVLRLNGWWGNRFITVSEVVSAYVRGIGIAPDRVSLIHNSLHLPASPVAARDLPLFKSLGWDESVFIVIVVARLEPVKGHSFLIDALSRVAPERPQLRCLVVGEGRTRAALEDQVQRAGLRDRVHFTGFRDDIPALLSASDVFCLPSLSEGLPYALLEAGAHRLPLLCTKVGGMAELLIDGETALLVPPSDAEALAENLRWLIDHPAEAAALGQAAFDSLKDRFDPDEMVAQTLALYQS